MAKMESYDAGTFSWAELASTDADAARDFYGKLFGWSYEDVPVGEDAVYTLASTEEGIVAALMQADGPPRWNSYISVDDVDAVTEKAKEAGAKVHAEPFDVMEAGRMSVIQDPTGGVVSLWQAGDRAGADVVNVHGALTWNDLMTYDAGAAAEFYCEVFGWEVAELGASGDDADSEDSDEDDADGGGDSGKIHVDADDATSAPGAGDEGPSDEDESSGDDDEDDEDEESDEPGSQTTRGEDQRLAIRNGERMNGGIATIPRSAGETVPPHWLPYFAVESIEAAVTDVRDGGGEVMAGPIDVPRGKMAVAADPTGAVFGLFAGTMDD